MCSVTPGSVECVRKFAEKLDEPLRARSRHVRAMDTALRAEMGWPGVDTSDISCEDILAGVAGVLEHFVSAAADAAAASGKPPAPTAFDADEILPIRSYLCERPVLPTASPAADRPTHRMPRLPRLRFFFSCITRIGHFSCRPVRVRNHSFVSAERHIDDRMLTSSLVASAPQIRPTRARRPL